MFLQGVVVICVVFCDIFTFDTTKVLKKQGVSKSQNAENMEVGLNLNKYEKCEKNFTLRAKC